MCQGCQKIKTCLEDGRIDFEEIDIRKLNMSERAELATEIIVSGYPGKATVLATTAPILRDDSRAIPSSALLGDDGNPTAELWNWLGSI